MKVSLFFLIHPANSKSRENSGILTRFPCFCLIFNTSFAYCVTGETVETTTDQRNLSIIGRDKIYISSKKREEMQFIYLLCVNSKINPPPKKKKKKKPVAPSH